jgi:glycosyltransferase involved in cell wall biosynthesis
MLITVAICTLNRAESLRRTLDSLTAMRAPDDVDWEVVVVNNNCSDHTDEVVKAFAERLPIRGELEPKRGKSHALNRAVAAAKGDYIVWTDDDVVVDPGWLAAYREAFRRWPDAAVFGGRIVERFDEPVPNWVVQSKALLTFAALDFGEDAVPLSVAEDARLPFGANLAVRGIEQRQFSYDPDIGPGSGRGPIGEEWDLIRRILRSGATGYWIPNATVTHCIARERLTIRALSQYYAGCGEVSAFFSPNAVASTPLLFNVPRWRLRQLIEGWVRYRIARLVSPAPVWVRHLKQYTFAWGAVRCYWRNARQRPLHRSNTP